MTRKYGSKQINYYADWRSLTVTYRREDSNLIVTRAGFGRDYRAALADADAHLKPGAWTRLSISQPSSILRDVQNEGKPRHKNLRNRPGEGDTVIVPIPQVIRRKERELSDD